MVVFVVSVAVGALMRVAQHRKCVFVVLET